MPLNPFVIRFFMDSPVILSDGASLDAVMAYQGFENGGDGLELLDRLFAREGRIHSASWLFCEKEHLTDRAEFVRLQRVGAALNIDNLKPSRGMTKGFRVDNKRGIAANKLTTYKTIVTPSVWAFATGDIAAAADALSNVTSIGVKRPYGLGRVRRIEISRAEGWPGFGHLMSDGLPARAIPLDQWSGGAKRGAYAIGFPRWSAPAETCAIPSEKFIDPKMFGALTPEMGWDVE